MKNMAKYTNEFKKSVAEYYASNEGVSFKSVAEKFNIHPTLARNWYLKYSAQDVPATTPSVSSDVAIDTDELESALEDLSYELDESFISGAGDFAPDDCSGIVLTVTDDPKLTIQIDVLTSLGEVEIVNGESNYVPPSNFNGDRCVTVIEDWFGSQIEDVLAGFNLSLNDIEIKASAYPEDGM